jgi:hypothetical protein
MVYGGGKIKRFGHLDKTKDLAAPFGHLDETKDPPGRKQRVPETQP